MSLQHPSDREAHNFMFGYGLRVSSLKEEDVTQFKIDLGDSLFEDCIAVYGRDLGECLACVVDASKAKLVWADVDGQGGQVVNEQLMAEAVIRVVTTLLPVEANSLD